MMDVKEPDVPWGDEWRPSRDFRRIADLFTPRNLQAGRSADEHRWFR